MDSQAPFKPIILHLYEIYRAAWPLADEHQPSLSNQWQALHDALDRFDDRFPGLAYSEESAQMFLDYLREE